MALQYSFIYRLVTSQILMRVKYQRPQSRLYTEHLEIQSKSLLHYSATRELPLLKNTQYIGLQTNYSIILKNQYAFLLLHLKKTQQTRNSLSINIPDICIFFNHQPYDIIYNDNGEVRGLRGKEPIRLKEIYNFFKNKWKIKGLNKDEPCVACFQKQQYLMMSDTDLFITCRKFKNDPFFAKIAYIRNKVNAADNPNPIKVEYDQIQDAMFTGQATQSLMNIQDEGQIFQRYGEYKYLRYCNTKICLFLNYEHNIRVTKAYFYYLKNNKNEYVFANVSGLEFSNLTNAIKQREKRLKIKQSLRNQCLVMNSEKEERYRRHESSPKVEIIQKSMNESWLKIANNLKIKTNQQRIREHQRNQKAFHILFPSLTDKFDVILTQNNFKRIKRELFKFQQRKPIFKSTNHHLKFSSNRSITQPCEKYTDRDRS